jgi:carbon-monoxide dehydrogenase large subunit
VTAGAAIAHAAATVGERLRVLAAELLEASPADLEVRGPAVQVRGVPDRAVALAEVVARADLAPPASLPSEGRGEPATPASLTPPSRIERGAGGVGPLLPIRAEHYFEPPAFTYANAVQAALVEVDVETGRVALLKLVVVHDSGRIINPVLADGQVCGGVAQGIGNALMEEVVYDENGQLVTGSLMDYLVPTACDVPPIALGHFESPTPRNPLGFKGLGEGGAIAPPAAIANAVEDALRPFGVEVSATPLTPERVLARIELARQRLALSR